MPWRSLQLVTAVCLFASAALAQQVTPPAGWTTHRDGSAQVLVPPEGDFRLTIFPEEDLAGQSLETWFQGRVRAEANQRGTLVKAGNPDHTRSGVLTLTAEVREARGTQVRMFYNGVPRGASKAQLVAMRINEPVDMLRKHAAAGANIVAQLRFGRDAIDAVAQSPTAAPASPPSQPQQAPQAPAQQAAAPATRSAGNAVAALMHVGKGVYEVDGYHYKENVVLLLADGSAHRDLRVAPEDLDADASRRSEPQKWTRWRKEGTGYALLNTKSGQWEKLGGSVVRALPSGGGLNVSLVAKQAYSYGGFGGSVFSSEYQFRPDGRFERSSGALHGTGVMQGTTGYSGSAASHQGKEGRSSTAGGSYSGGQGEGSVSASSRSQSQAGAADATGVYRITGYTLELRAASGKVQRLLVFYPFSDSNDVYINGVTYSRPGR